MKRISFNPIHNGKKVILIGLACLFIFGLIGEAYEGRNEEAYHHPGPYRWPSKPPADCSFEISDDINVIVFTGKHVEYTLADTWYPSWASDGNMYSPWTDGSIGDMRCTSGLGQKAHTGNAKIIGDDPMNLEIIALGTSHASALPYSARYPCGSLLHNDIWYYGTYCLACEPDPYYNWSLLGPLVGFRISYDFGKTWTKTPHTPASPLFKEPVIKFGKVKIGAPHFVDFGQNMQHSPDGKAYLIGHGASDPDSMPRPANLSWISGDQIYLIRVKPSPETINDMSRYEFFAGYDNQYKPIWSRDFSEIEPLIEWNNRTGCVTMTYNAPLKKYLICITDGWPTVKPMNTYILESDNVTGPWKLVTFMKKFGKQGYFVNIPSKFISSDGQTAFLCYSANFMGDWKPNPHGSKYAMCLQQIKLLNTKNYRQYMKSPDTGIENPVKGEHNVARNAAISASSTFPKSHVYGAIDGIVNGYPRREWISNGEKEGAVLRLEWNKHQLINRIWLFDRPNHIDQITSGLLKFSDGSTIKVADKLYNDASVPKEVNFKPKNITWLEFIVTSVKQGTMNTGLAEIAVFVKKDEP